MYFFFFSFVFKIKTRLMKFIARCGLETRETKHVGLTDQTHGNFALLGEK